MYTIYPFRCWCKNYPLDT